MPHPDELSETAVQELQRERVSFKRAIEHCATALLGEGELEQAAAAMREDLLVHYALARLNRSTFGLRPSPAMVRDIRALFSSQAAVAEQATEYLMGLADEAVIVAAMERCAELGLGVIDEKRRLVVDGGRIDELHGVLRCYVGCASFFAGEPDPSSIVRVDPKSKRVSFLQFDNRMGPQPVSHGVTVVDLKRQSVIVRPSARRLLRMVDVLGELDGSDRALEQRYREVNDIDHSVVFERIAVE